MKPVKRLVVSGCVALPLVFAATVQAQQALEWKQSEGGNGHWYQSVAWPSLKTWPEARDAAIARGAILACITSAAENQWICSHLDLMQPHPRTGWHLGGYQDTSAPDYREPAGGWRWMSGEPWGYTAWLNAQNYGASVPGGDRPDNYGGDERYLKIVELPYAPWWDDVGPTNTNMLQGAILEWESDCNGDGIVDYGQILSGELVDSNGNGVPDCCDNGDACISSLVANGSFEAGSPLTACASESITSGNLLGSGWQVSAGIVDRTRGGSACASATQPRFGDHCIDLCGTPASSGAIRQIVATIPGHKYRCTFWLSGDASAAPSTKKVHAKVGSYIDLSYTFACAGSGAQSWVVNQFEFTARGASEALEFAADNGVTTAGPMIDAISLVDITTQCVGDLDVSGEVDGADIALLLLNFGPCPTTP